MWFRRRKPTVPYTHPLVEIPIYLIMAFHDEPEKELIRMHMGNRIVMAGDYIEVKVPLNRDGTVKIDVR